MAMKFTVEQKGQTFLVVNESIGDVRGRFKTKGEAEVYRDRLQKQHNDGIQMASARITEPQKSEEEGD